MIQNICQNFVRIPKSQMNFSSRMSSKKPLHINTYHSIVIFKFFSIKVKFVKNSCSTCTAYINLTIFFSIQVYKRLSRKNPKIKIINSAHSIFFISCKNYFKFWMFQVITVKYRKRISYCNSIICPKRSSFCL